MICKMDILFGHVHINAVICVTQTFLSALSRSPSLFIFKSSNFLSYYPAIFVLSFCGIWNLDFFRYLIPSFCIKKSLTPLQSAALEYVIAIYPLLLVAITYVSHLAVKDGTFISRPTHTTTVQSMCLFYRWPGNESFLLHS